MLIKSYLSSPRARRALATRPGEAGFSLIELVVVIAILGILIAIALPNFLGVQKDAQVNQAKNALATAIKECAVKATRYDSATFGQPGQTGAASVVQAANSNVKGYILSTDSDIRRTPFASAVPIALGASETPGGDSTKSCYNLQVYAEGGKLPHFSIIFDPATGDTNKLCTLEAADTYAEGCTGATPGTAGSNGTW